MITYGQVILQSLLHLKMSHIPFIQSCSLLATMGWGNEPAHLALWHLTALVLVSDKTGPSRSHQALGRLLSQGELGQKSWHWVSALLLADSGTV